MGTHYNRLGEAMLMNMHNIGFYEEFDKIIYELSSNIIKYAPYLFFCNKHPQIYFLWGADQKYPLMITIKLSY